MVSSTGWCTTLIGSKCVANRCAKNRERKGKNEGRAAGQKLGKSRAKIALGNRRSDSHFPTAPATTIFLLTTVIIFWRIQLQASLSSDRSSHVSRKPNH